MLEKPPVATLFLSAMAALLAAASGASFAEPADPAMEIEEIVVTGSRIQRRNLVSASPVTQVDADELLFQGTVRVEDMVRTLPQVYSAQNTSQSNGATGTATLNLRNLGSERTLVLVNGRRLPAGSPIQGGIGADINQIPGALVQSVEVLTGGASATYGSDAVAGVVNFLMKDDFEGVRVDYQFSQYTHNNDNGKWQGIVTNAGYPAADGTESDGDTSYVSLIIGGNFDDGRGNATAYATYRDIQAVWQRDRDYSSCALSDDTTFCFGSSTIPQGRFTNFGVGGPGVDYIVSGHEFVERQGETFNYGPAQLLSAARRAVHFRRLRPLQRGRVRGDLHGVDVHGRPVGLADRPVRKLLRDQHPELRQRAALGTAVRDRLRLHRPDAGRCT